MIDSFSTFHTWTEKDFNALAYLTRIEMVGHMCLSLPKLCVLLREIDNIVLKQHQKLIIFADSPVNIWTIELLMDVLQLKYCSNRSGITSAKRAEAEHLFNHSNDVQILVATSRSASKSINPQKGGSHIVIIGIATIRRSRRLSEGCSVHGKSMSSTLLSSQRTTPSIKSFRQTIP